jgi:hypothetical protein
MEGTKDQLEYLLSIINNYAKIKGAGEFYLEKSYGKPRLFQKAGNGSREISPRLPRPTMYLWLLAFIAGMDFITLPTKGY